MIGTTIAHYEILEARSVCGLGDSYLARDTTEGRLVTVHLLPRELSRDPDAIQRALHEARTVCRPSHPHICTVHDAGLHDGAAYLVTEVTEGRPLSALVSHGPLDLQVILDFGVQIADALGTAHARGIAHEALDPRSVLVTEGDQVKVMDFGVARIAGRATGGGPAGDLAALGRILEEMARGASSSSRIEGPLPPLLEPIVRRSLGGCVEGAFGSVAEMAGDLTRAMTEAGPRFVPPPFVPLPMNGKKESVARSRRVALAATGVLLAGLAVGILTCS